MTTNKQDYIIHKPNFAILTNNNITLLQRKMFNYLIYQFSKNNWQEYVTLTKNEINFVLDPKGTKLISHAELRNILKGLLTSLLVYIEDSNTNLFEYSTYFTSLEITRNDFKISMSSLLRNNLNINYIHLDKKKNIFKGYTKLDLTLLNQFTSVHALPMYELLKCKGYITKNFSIEFDVLLSLFAQGKESYKEFKNFNAKVLKKAIQQINSISDIYVTYKPIKRGVFVKSVEFTITKNCLKKPAQEVA